MNCSWRALRLPKEEDHRFSCRVIPAEGIEYDFTLLKERDERRLDTAYKSEISIIIEPHLYSGQFPNGTYYLPRGRLELAFIDFNRHFNARTLLASTNI